MRVTVENPYHHNVKFVLNDFEVFKICWAAMRSADHVTRKFFRSAFPTSDNVGKVKLEKSGAENRVV